MFKFLVPAVALAFAFSPVQAGVTITDEFVQTDFDIAGVTLGMLPEEAKKQVESRGYKPQENQMEKGPSFDDLVNIASGATQPNAIKSSWKQMRFNKGDESIDIQFKPLPLGNGVSEVTYSHYSHNISMEKFKPMAVSKFGAPKYEDSYGTIWSDKPLNSSNEPDKENAGIYLRLSGSSNNARLHLKGGRIGAIDAEKEAENWSPPVKSTF